MMFEITLQNEQKILLISSVGYKLRNNLIKKKNKIDLEMSEH